MTCHNCKCDCKKFGFFGPERIQRYRCKQCGKSFSDIPARPLDDLRIPLEKAVQIIHMLVEGVGVRATARLADVHRDTVLAVLEVAGQKCAKLMDQRVRNVPFDVVQADELFCFVHCKERHNVTNRRDIGEQYVYLAMHATSKFIINFGVGKRDAVTTQQYMQDLRKRVRVPFQLTTDGFPCYVSEVFYTFLNQIDFAQSIKHFANPTESQNQAEHRYSPSVCVSVQSKVICGDPDPAEISTSYAERTNLSMRLFNRRFTRLTLGYSKKLANLKHSIALFIAHFNYCRKHSAHGMTPAQGCGLADHVWTIEELLAS